MHFSGSVRIDAPRDRVYAFLLDPQRVGSCGPGVESVVVRDPTHFRVVAKVGVGFISTRINSDLELVEAVKNEMAVLRGTGRVPGSSVEGTARMRLSDAPAGGTRMDWEPDVAIHGRIAGLGARLLQGTAEEQIARTFACIGSTLESEKPSGVAPRIGRLAGGLSRAEPARRVPGVRTGSPWRAVRRSAKEKRR